MADGVKLGEHVEGEVKTSGSEASKVVKQKKSMVKGVIFKHGHPPKEKE